MFSLVYAITHNEEHFSDPMTFNPDRFLNNKGKYVKDKHMILFSMGRRRCPGEAMARNESFLVLARFVQKFKFKSHMKDKIDMMTMEGRPGLVFSPLDFTFYLETRTETGHL